MFSSKEDYQNVTHDNMTIECELKKHEGWLTLAKDLVL